MADLLVLPRLAKSFQNGQASAKKLEHTGPAKKERVASVPHSEQLASMPDFAKRRKNRAISPNYQIMRWESGFIATK